MTVNGERVTRSVPVRQHLVDFLRMELGLTGSHIGCEHGICGACSVRVDGAVVRGCLMLAVQADGSEVVTIEGLTESGEIADSAGEIRRAQRAAMRLLHAGHADHRCRAAQAGKARYPRDDIRAFLSGNYCRCTGYHAIVDAVEDTLKARLDDSGEATQVRSSGVKHSAGIPNMDAKARLTPLDRPNSYVGRTAHRARAHGARWPGAGPIPTTSRLPRMVHAAFVRSPHAHARIRAHRDGAAERAPGVVKVMTGAEIAKMCTAPWVGTLTCFPGMKSAPQYPMAVDRACWQGEPVVMVVAQTRALAEDAAELVEIEWQELPAVAHKETALDPQDARCCIADLGDNLAFRKVIDTGGVDAAFAGRRHRRRRHVQLRAAHRGEPRAARHPRRLRQAYAAARRSIPAARSRT